MHQLYTIAFSHYCEKARWALDRSGEPYREHGYAPLSHLLGTLPRGGRSTPMLVTSNGERLTDSTDILLYLDRRSPGSLYPTDAAGRAEVLALEDEIDEQIGPHARRLAYFAIFEDGGAPLYAKLLRATMSGWQRRAAPVLARVGRPLITRGLRIDAAGAARSRERLEEALEPIEARLADGRRTLIGDRVTAADLTLAAILAPLVRPPEQPVTGPAEELVGPPTPRVQALLDEHRARPTGQYALRMYRELRRETPSS